MDLRERAETAIKEACAALGASLSDEQMQAVTRIIEQALIDAIREAAKQSTSAALSCCEHDQDMAHKISHEIERSQKALVANLSSLR
ncbi:MAG: hypothetical protein MI920_29935 [Kiloniellales bacterium]|nr:hypothetical protein [Kiloniellales bacterium]